MPPTIHIRSQRPKSNSGRPPSRGKPDPGPRSLLCMAMASGALVGDLDAFEEAVRTQSRALFSLARAILGDRQEAEDAVAAERIGPTGVLSAH